MTARDLAVWMEDQEWRVVAKRSDRVVAERRMLGSPHDWFVMFLQQLPGRAWMARLSRREPCAMSTSGNVYGWIHLAAAADLESLADVGLWLGGELSRTSEHAA